MPKIDIASIPLRTGSSYPARYAPLMEGRSQQKLGDAAGITQFGANLVHLMPGAISALRHWHERQDEFAVVLSGALVLRDDFGDTALAAGDCVAFPAGDANGHHILNLSDTPGSFLVIGTRTETETGWYSDHDMKVTADASGLRFTTQDGAPVPDAP